MVHIAEFHRRFDPSRQAEAGPLAERRLPGHLSRLLQPARAMGLFEEPRYIIKNVCNHFHEMAEDTIREKTLCCGSGAGLGNEENEENADARRDAPGHGRQAVREKYGVNRLACMCAIDRAALTALMGLLGPGVAVTGVHELLANALVMQGETERTTDLRGEALGGRAADEAV